MNTAIPVRTWIFIVVVVTVLMLVGFDALSQSTTDSSRKSASNPWTFVLTSNLSITYANGGQLTQNFHEEFSAPPGSLLSCEPFAPARKHEFIIQQIVPQLMKDGQEVTASINVACLKDDRPPSDPAPEE